MLYKINDILNPIEEGYVANSAFTLNYYHH